jgi:RNA polymerase sigma factor (sigma-70 family)
MRPANNDDANLTKRSDTELLALTAKDPEAFGLIYERHNRAIFAYLMRRVGDPAVAEELTAEVFAAAFIGADRYRPEKPVLAWLFGIAKLTLLASYRKRAIEQTARRHLGMDVGDSRDQVWEEVERRLDSSVGGVVDGLDSLGRDQRHALIARILDERSYADIAVATNTSEAAVRQRVSRGLRKLTELVKRPAK